MKKLRAAVIGISQGDDEIFSDFEDDGDMWSGSGDRERRKWVGFDPFYQKPPTVHVSISLWDVASGTNTRAEVCAETVGTEGFELVFRTWSDTRVARARMSWIAIGELPGDEDWDV